MCNFLFEKAIVDELCSRDSRLVILKSRSMKIQTSAAFQGGSPTDCAYASGRGETRRKRARIRAEAAKQERQSTRAFRDLSCESLC